ncbi:MAG: helical backbone metal receptor [Endomicrobium sp.]|jgi:iron complex transport system substrate-binding protein|nr:helical backbone metal receptor [Endomicrobium sp.]
MRFLNRFFIVILIFFNIRIVYGNLKQYKRIICLAPSVTKSLYELNMEKYIKGITSYCPSGNKKYRKEIVGSILNPNIEKIISLNPDLVILSKDANMVEISTKLHKLGIETYVINAANNFNDICTNYLYLSKKINKDKLASKIINLVKKNIKNKCNTNNNKNKLKVFWIVGISPLYTIGNKSFINDYLLYSKTINIYNKVNKNYFQVNLEDVIKHNPDIIVLINTKYDTKEMKFFSKLNNNNKIILINYDYMFLPTPLSFLEGLNKLFDVLNKIK